MPHSYSRIWIHSIWATKKREPFILPSIEAEVYRFLAKQFIDFGSPVRIINGMPDHVHCLFLLNSQKSIAETIKQVKGSSSHFINEKGLTKEVFAWQTGYGAYSVSESVLEKVYQYIKHQKTHHRNHSFENEFKDFVRLHGMQYEDL